MGITQLPSRDCPVVNIFPVQNSTSKVALSITGRG